MSGTWQGSACWERPRPRPRPTVAAPVARPTAAFPRWPDIWVAAGQIRWKVYEEGQKEEDDEGGGRKGKEGEGRTINLEPGPCVYGGWKAGGSPGDNLSPWISVQMAGQGTHRTSSYWFRRENREPGFALGARASTNCTVQDLHDCFFPLSFLFFIFFLSFSSSSQVICADPEGEVSRGCARKWEVGARYEYKSTDLAGWM